MDVLPGKPQNEVIFQSRVVAAAMGRAIVHVDQAVEARMVLMPDLFHMIEHLSPQSPVGISRSRRRYIMWPGGASAKLFQFPKSQGNLFEPEKILKPKFQKL